MGGKQKDVIKGVCLRCQYVNGPPQEGGMISQCAGGKVRIDWGPVKGV